MENAAAMPTRGSLVWRGLANILLGLVAIGWPGLTLYVLVIVFAINIIAVGAVDLFRPFFEKNTKHAVLTVILGLLAIMVGFYLLGRPELTVSIMGLVIAFWAMLFGISDLFIGFGDSSNPAGYRILFIFTGVLSILFGFYLLAYPIASLVTLVWIVGVFALLSGIAYILGSFFLPDAKK